MQSCLAQLKQRFLKNCDLPPTQPAAATGNAAHVCIPTALTLPPWVTTSGLGTSLPLTWAPSPQGQEPCCVSPKAPTGPAQCLAHNRDTITPVRKDCVYDMERALPVQGQRPLETQDHGQKVTSLHWVSAELP